MHGWLGGSGNAYKIASLTAPALSVCHARPLETTFGGAARSRRNSSTRGDRRNAGLFTRLLNLGVVVQDHVQQRGVHFQFSVVFDKAQFAEFVHEKTNA
jgi:hypothetical protein